MAHNNIADGRNVTDAEQSWDSAIDFSQSSNTYKLVRALLSQADRIDDNLGQVYDAHHINTATGKELEQYGKLVNTPRQSGEPDAKYRARIKAEFAQSQADTDFNSFVQFCSSILNTSEENIEFITNYDGSPATVTIAANGDLYDSVALTASEIADLFGGGVPAGHSVRTLERGTFRLKTDSDVDDADKGLTSDSIETGGTLAADLVE
jgi:hypothetical protein